jgi:hypothetical protein
MEKIQMNSLIETHLNAVVKLDSWDIQSILGGVNYIAKQAALNIAVRMLPDLPEEGSGNENFAMFDAAMKNPEIKKSANPIIGIANRVSEVLVQYTDNPPSQYKDVLEFMVSRPPQRKTFQNEYDNRRKLGMRPQMPMGQFVDMEYATALTRHSHLVAKGEAAVRVLDGFDGSDEQAPEWLYDAIHTKIGQKLEERWFRSETRRTNPKISKADRDLAAANQELIESVMIELGFEKPDFSKEMAASDDLDDFNAATAAKNKPA